MLLDHMVSGTQASSLVGVVQAGFLCQEHSLNSPTFPSQTWMSVHWAPTTALNLRRDITSRAVSAACASSAHQTMSVSRKRECLQLWCDPEPFMAPVPQAQWQVVPAVATSCPFL